MERITSNMGNLRPPMRHRPVSDVTTCRLTCCEPLLQAAADFAHAAAELPAQQRSQSHAFGIADFGGDLVDTGVYFD
jgi:hypothetical protein